MNDDPVAALVTKWERAKGFEITTDKPCVVYPSEMYARELREALKLRPRSEAENVDLLNKIREALKGDEPLGVIRKLLIK